MRALLILLAMLGLAAKSDAQPATPSPAPTPIVAATPQPRPLGLGFGGTAVAQPTPAPSQANAARGDSLSAVASKIKLRRLTAEELKTIRSTEGSAGSSPNTPPVLPGPASDEQRQAAMEEFEDTFGPLHQRAVQVDAERRACNSACMGTTSGSAFTTDMNGNWVVINTSVDNSTTPQCRQCQVHWRAEADQITLEYNRARERAHQQGVMLYELDSHRLVFGNAPK